MDKLKMMSMDKVQANIEKIRALFPNAVTEVLRDGKPTLAVDFDVLKQELTSDLVVDSELRYQFTWPDKQKAVLRANEPTNKTLRPCREESVDFDSTQNLYIEGDNLEVLKLLQETYLSKIKMIYIDPPYNTGNDFVYNDDFVKDSTEYKENSGQFDEDGNNTTKSLMENYNQNLESNGRFHTDWLNMIYPRLKLAKDLLSDDGMIFISIDDNEQANLKKVCDEIFGGQNFLTSICINKSSEIASNFTVKMDEAVLVYVKNINEFNLKTIEKFTVSRGTVGNRDQTMPVIQFPAGLMCYGLKDGVYESTRKIPDSLENIENFDPIVIENGKLKNSVRLQARWRSSNDMRNFFANNCRPTPAKINGEIVEIYFENDKFNPQIKKRTYEKIPTVYLKNKRGSDDLKELDLVDIFTFPKSVSLIKYFINFAPKNALVLDFFSGSATTAHSVMQLNAEDGGNRKFIMVQLPELCDEKSEAYKAGYKNICEIGKERIRRAGAKIKEENGLTAQNLDIGFRVFKLDSSNMQDVYYKPEEYSQTLLDNLQDNIKSDRTALDLLFQVMLELGKPLSAKITQKVIAGKSVFNVDDGDLIACFEDNITSEVVTEIAKGKPLYAVFRDSGLSSDSVAANFEQIFATYSPNTKRKVL